MVIVTAHVSKNLQRQSKLIHRNQINYWLKMTDQKILSDKILLTHVRVIPTD